MDQSRIHVHTLELTVRWCDMDAFGHVNNSVYLSYFESARISWWDAIKPKDTSFLNVGPVVINASCTFFKAIHYPEKLLIHVYVGPPGRSSHECYYTILSATQKDVLYAEGQTKIVWVDRTLEKSIPLPDYVTKHLPTAKSS